MEAPYELNMKDFVISRSAIGEKIISEGPRFVGTITFYSLQFLFFIIFLSAFVPDAEALSNMMSMGFNQVSRSILFLFSTA
jgi:hypothetical protein